MTRTSIVLLALALSAQTALAQSDAHCGISVGRDNNAPLTNNCPTYNLGPPPLPDGIYQSGQLIGRVRGALYDGTSPPMTITDLRISSGTVDLQAPMQIQHVTFSCPSLKQARGGAAMTVISIQGEQTCDVIKNNN
jgi:hypothetical protein